MRPPKFVPAPQCDDLVDGQILQRAREFYETMRRRRSICNFSGLTFEIM
jgi:hypothetical protein